MEAQQPAPRRGRPLKQHLELPAPRPSGRPPKRRSESPAPAPAPAPRRRGRPPQPHIEQVESESASRGCPQNQVESASRGRPQNQVESAPRGRPQNLVRRPRRTAPSPPQRNFEEEQPVLAGDLQASPLNAEDLAIWKEFNTQLAQDKMERCPRCKKQWFDVKLQADGICKHCHLKDDKKRLEEPYFFSAANRLDFGIVPTYLPQLLPAEEMVIARVHVSVNVFSVCSIAFLLYLLLTLSRFVANSSNIAVMLSISFEMLGKYTRSFPLCLQTWILLFFAHQDRKAL